MEPEQPESIESVPDGAPQDAPLYYDGGTLAMVGGLSGLLVIVAIAVVVGLRLRGRPTPEFQEPEEQVIPAEHRGELPEIPTPVAPVAGTGLVGRLRVALSRSREALQGRFDALFGRDTVDDALFEQLEETLLTADVGVHTTDAILGELRELAGKGDADPDALRKALREAIRTRLAAVDSDLTRPDGAKPWVILVVGVNGSGKTTTIGKLAARFRDQGLSVMLAAGDTYRAAAADPRAAPSLPHGHCGRCGKDVRRPRRRCARRVPWPASPQRSGVPWRLNW